jgi:hypothetical protein
MNQVSIFVFVLTFHEYKARFHEYKARLCLVFGWIINCPCLSLFCLASSCFVYRCVHFVELFCLQRCSFCWIVFRLNQQRFPTLGLYLKIGLYRCFFLVIIDRFHCIYLCGLFFNYNSNLWQLGSFLQVLRFPPSINLPLRYNRNIVESGVKHHNPKFPIIIGNLCWFNLYKQNTCLLWTKKLVPMRFCLDRFHCIFSQSMFILLNCFVYRCVHFVEQKYCWKWC